MLDIQRILCPVDFSESSAKAYDYAYSLAQRYKAKLYAQHVIPVPYPYGFPDVVGYNVYGELNKGAEERLQEMIEHHRVNGIEAEMIVRKGFVPDSILALAQDQQVDLIVIGTHGRRGLDRLVMGSVTESVLRKANCPVLAVRKPAHDFVNPDQKDGSVKLKKILLCTDFSNCANAAAKYALSLAQEYNSELTLFHVIEDFPKERAGQATREVHQNLRKTVPEGADNWCTVKTAVRIGKPYEEIIQFALEQQSDLAVLGVRGRSAVDLAIFGSTTHRVLQLGPCPVLTVNEVPVQRETT